MSDGLREALRELLPGHRVASAEPLGRGHIHRTYLATCSDAGGATERFVAQRINTHVFHDVDALARNVECVTEHVQRCLAARGAPDAERRGLRLVRAPSGASIVRDADGEPWRAFPYLEGTRAPQLPASAAQAQAAARAFGGFLADLADLASERLAETIPAFHDLAARLAALERVEAADAHAGAADARPERAAAHDLARRIAALARDERALPRRVVHNDCKLDNVLLDAASGEALCVVDLDTVMPGHAHFDFGELVRTGVCEAAEDEGDAARLALDLDRFRALAEAFVAGARGRLDPAEIRAFAWAGPRMALENGVRFLTDHLDGDRYFGAAHPGQNLERARTQLALAERLLGASDAMRDVVAALAR